jgi:hypothetical protein
MRNPRLSRHTRRQDENLMFHFNDLSVTKAYGCGRGFFRPRRMPRNAAPHTGEFPCSGNAIATFFPSGFIWRTRFRALRNTEVTNPRKFRRNGYS